MATALIENGRYQPDCGKEYSSLPSLFLSFYNFYRKREEYLPNPEIFLSHAPYLDIFLADEGYRGRVLDFYLEPALTGTCEDDVFI